MPRASLFCAVAGAAILVISAGQAGPSAVEQFQSFQQSLLRDRKENDWRSYLTDAEHLRTFLNDSPTSNLEVARAQLQLGNNNEAAADVRRFLAMGQIHPILASPLFRPLSTHFEAEIKANQDPISRTHRLFTFSDAGLLPEDIDYDSTSKRFFVTSILEKKVVALDARGAQRSFAEAPDHWPMVAVKVDTKRHRLWATEVAFAGFAMVAKSDWGRSALLEYDLDRGALLSRFEGPPHSNLGDMVLSDSGDPIVSDGDGGGIYRIHDHKMRRLDHGDFVSPQTLAICGDPTHAFVPDYVRGMAILDLKTGETRWLSTKGRYDLDGIDGLNCRGNVLMAVQNGASPERLVSFAFDISTSSIAAQRVLERGEALDPTHGVFVGSAFYYIANSGWGSLDEHGAVKRSATLTAARLMRYE
ncbi:MAG: hypothetical protein KGM97_05730 [Alphaproteobacteria bacterium]|nr:hypothetical protein [Alphaproteobacteria bacterium]MDE2630473.1 hypothetical protein [Alphaproteobacteria bacterium]